MTSEPNNTSLALHFGLVATLSDVIAPLVNSIASGIVFVISKFSKPKANKKSKPAGIHAPHAAMVLVPGNFVTEPFINR